MGPLRQKLKSLSWPGRSRKFAAVDFDSRGLRIVQAELVGRNVRIQKLSGVAMPEGFNLADAQALGTLLGQAMRDLGLQGGSVVMNVPRGQAVLKPITLPPGTAPGEMAAMVQYQVEKELPFRPEEAVIDFAVQSHFGAAPGQEAPAGTEVLVAAVRLPVVDFYRQVALSAEVTLEHLGLRPYANACCVEACMASAPRHSLALVHVMADETEIDVLSGASVAFSRSAVVKIPSGEHDSPEADEAVRSVAMEVARSIQSYQTVEGAERIDAVLVAGGTGVEGALAGELSRELAARCEVFSPALALRLLEAPDIGAFISSLGLALSARGGAMPFDFLHPKRPPVQRDMKRIRAVAGAAAALLVLAVAFGAGWANLRGKQADILRLSDDLDKLKKTNAKDVAPMEKRLSVVQSWCAMDRDWLDHWANLSSIFPPAKDAYITLLKTATDSSTLRLDLRVREKSTIAELNQRLVGANYVSKPQQETKTSDEFGYIYSSSRQLVIPPRMEVNMEQIEPAGRPSDDVSAEKLRPSTPPTPPPPAPPARAEPRQVNRSAATQPAEGPQPPRRDRRGTTR